MKHDLFPDKINLPPFEIEVFYDGCSCERYYKYEKYNSKLFIDSSYSVQRQRNALFNAILVEVFNNILKVKSLTVENCYDIANEMYAIIQDNPFLMIKDALPESVRVFGNDVSIEFVDELSYSRLGEIDHNDFKIKLLKDNPNCHKRTTIWHELLHHIIFHCSIALPENDLENLCSIGAIYIELIFKYNEMYWLWLK